ncbi:hypothetical protein HDK90DRAFT_552629, partial [Phyllosticta capitalensis]
IFPQDQDATRSYASGPEVWNCRRRLRRRKCDSKRTRKSVVIVLVLIIRIAVVHTAQQRHKMRKLCRIDVAGSSLRRARLVGAVGALLRLVSGAVVAGVELTDGSHERRVDTDRRAALRLAFLCRQVLGIPHLPKWRLLARVQPRSFQVLFPSADVQFSEGEVWICEAVVLGDLVDVALGATHAGRDARHVERGCVVSDDLLEDVVRLVDHRVREPQADFGGCGGVEWEARGALAHAAARVVLAKLPRENVVVGEGLLEEVSRRLLEHDTVRVGRTVVGRGVRVLARDHGVVGLSFLHSISLLLVVSRLLAVETVAGVHRGREGGGGH